MTLFNAPEKGRGLNPAPATFDDTLLGAPVAARQAIEVDTPTVEVIDLSRPERKPKKGAASKKARPARPPRRLVTPKAERIERNNARAAERLADDGSQAAEKKKLFNINVVGKKSKVDDIAETLEDLAAMLEAGESEERAVLQLAEQYSKMSVGQAYKRAADRMRNDGLTIIEALSVERDVFPRVARELLSAGTTPRDLHTNLRQAARIIVGSSDVKAQIRAALFKPMMTLSIVLVFVLVASEFLLPGVVSMFTSIGAEPPAATVVMISIGKSVKWVMGGIALLLVGALVFWIFFGRKQRKLRIWRDKAAINAPLIGSVTQMNTAARFADVLAACLSSGMTELDALEIAARSCGNEAVDAHVREHIVKQRIGEAVFADVARTPLFPWNLGHRIDIAPSPRQRIEIMRDLAKTFHKKSERRLASFVDKVGPISELFVLSAAGVVILMIALPVATFAPALMSMTG